MPLGELEKRAVQMVCEKTLSLPSRGLRGPLTRSCTPTQVIRSTEIMNLRSALVSMLQTRLDTSPGQLPLDASSESPPVGLPAPTAESTTRSGGSLHIALKPCAQCFRPVTHAALRRDFDGELYCRECWEEEYGPSEQPDRERSDSKADSKPESKPDSKPASSVTPTAPLSNGWHVGTPPDTPVAAKPSSLGVPSQMGARVAEAGARRDFYTPPFTPTSTTASSSRACDSDCNRRSGFAALGQL